MNALEHVLNVSCLLYDDKSSLPDETFPDAVTNAFARRSSWPQDRETTVSTMR